MRTPNFVAMLGAVGALAIVSSPASAVVCSTPAIGYFSDVHQANPNLPVYLDCLSRNANNVVKYAKATGSANPTSDRVSVTLHEGTYAYAGAYNSNRQGVGCFVEDFSPAGLGVSKACGVNIAFFDLYVENP